MQAILNPMPLTTEQELARKDRELRRFMSLVDLEGASRDFREAIAIKSNWPPAHLGLATCYQQRGDIRGSLKILQKSPRRSYLRSEKVFDSSFETHYFLTVYYAALDDRENARPSTPISLPPHYPRGHGIVREVWRVACAAEEVSCN